MITIENLNETIQEAMANNKWVAAKANGKLLRIAPVRGWTIVLEDGETALVSRSANNLNDFMIEYPDGSRERRNSVNGDIKGYIKG